MRNLCVFVGVLLLCLVAGCATTSGGPTKFVDPRPVHFVKTVDEFLNAVGSDRIIQLAPGDYVLSDVSPRDMKHVNWAGAHDGNSVQIHSVRNLSIVGPTDKPARLLTRPRYVLVLELLNCTNVELANLTLGHAPEKGFCTNGVLGVTYGSNVTVRNCDLFGCGTEGLCLTGTKNLRVENTIIRDCSYGILTAKDCTDVTFTSCTMKNNQQYWGIRLFDCTDTRFETCHIQNNMSEEPLFTVVSSTGTSFIGGAIEKNKAPSLTDAPEKFVPKLVRLSENRLEPR